MNQPTQNDHLNRAEGIKETIANLYDLPKSQLTTEWEVANGIFSGRVIDLISGHKFEFKESCGPEMNVRCF